MYGLRLKITSPTALICASVVLLGISYAMAEAENTSIDEDEATKLSIIASYHADYGRVSGFDLRLYSDTGRRLVDIFELESLDGNDKFYAVTLYRASEDPKTGNQIDIDASDWSETAVNFAAKSDDMAYTWSIPPEESLSVWEALYSGPEELHQYYSCVVPAAETDGFLFEFHRGISAYVYMKELAHQILAMELGREGGEIELLRSSPAYDFMFDVNGKKYVVSIPIMEFELKITIREDDKLTEYIKNTEPRFELPPELERMGDYDYYGNEMNAKNEDIALWADYISEIDGTGDFDANFVKDPSGILTILEENDFPTLRKLKSED